MQAKIEIFIVYQTQISSFRNFHNRLIYMNNSDEFMNFKVCTQQSMEYLESTY